jgi:Family of unknown function (DUF5677)
VRHPGDLNMKIEGNGFLGSDLPNIEQTVPGASRALFQVLFDLCTLAEQLKSDLVIEGQESAEEKQKVIAAIFFIRLVEIVQSVVILAAHGVREELNSMFRIFLDAYFVFANCCTSADFIPTYFRTDLPARLKLLNSVAKHQTALFALVNEYATAEIKGELESEIKAEKIDAFNSKAFADNINCDEIYDSMYRIMSASVHTTPRCLGHYVEEDAEGNIITVRHGSDPIVTDQRVYDVAWFFILALRGVVELFSMQRSAELDSLELRLKAEARIPETTLMGQKT